MNSHTNGQVMFFLVCASFALVLLTNQGAEARLVGVPSPQCHPSVVGSMPPRIRKICEALETIMEFSDSMENYLEEKGESYYFYRCCLCHTTDFLLAVLCLTLTVAILTSIFEVSVQFKNNFIVYYSMTEQTKRS